MKRMCSLVIALLMVFAFSACGLEDYEDPESTIVEEETVEYKEPISEVPEGAVVTDHNGIWGLYIEEIHFLSENEIELVDNFTGIASNDYGKWYIEKGLVDFNKNGTVNIDGKDYVVQNGKVFDSERELEIEKYKKEHNVDDFAAKFSLDHPDKQITKVYYYETGAGTHTDYEIGDLLLIHGYGDGGGSSYTSLVTNRGINDTNKTQFLNDALELYKYYLSDEYYSILQKDIELFKSGKAMKAESGEWWYGDRTTFKQNSDEYTHQKTQYYNYILHFRISY